MPLYEFECEACTSRFERIQKFTDPNPDACPTCGKSPVRKLPSSPAIQFKGSGFYITDYPKKSSPDSSGKSDGGGDSSSSSGSDSKESKSTDTKSTDTKSTDTKSSDAKSSDAKSSDTKSSDTKSSDSSVKSAPKKD